MSFPPGSYADMPVITLEHVFSYLTVHELISASKVCSTWRTVLGHKQFWFRRLHQLGISHLICPELKRNLLEEVDQIEILNWLQAVCLYKEDIQLFRRYFGDILGEGGTWFFKIDEKNIFEASVLLLFHTFHEIKLIINSDFSVINNIDILLLVLSYTSCELFIQDQYSWRNQCKPSTSLIKLLSEYKECRIKELWTTLTTIEYLPVGLVCLHLGVFIDPTTDNIALDPGISKLKQRCPRLTSLYLHVKAGTVMNSIPKLPDTQIGPQLFVSNMSDNSHVQWVVKVAKTLQPKCGYQGLHFPSSKLNVAQLCKLVNLLAKKRIHVVDSGLSGCFAVSSHHTDEEESKLHGAVKRHLKTRLHWDVNELSYF